MKALTVRQPWAHLIVQDRKTYELRSWGPPPGVEPGERLAIYAGATMGPDVQSFIEAVFGPGNYTYGGVGREGWRVRASGDRLAFGALIGTVRLVGVWRVADRTPDRVDLLPHCGRTAFPRRTVIIGPGGEAHGLGDWDFWQRARYAWEFDRPHRFEHPRRMRGGRSLWEVPAE